MVFNFLFTFMFQFNLVPPNYGPQIPVESPMSPIQSKTVHTNSQFKVRHGRSL